MIKLFSSQQIKQWDQYTIKNEPISSLDLMERASLSFVNWYANVYNKNYSIHIFCGPGNNGGDGFAIGRLLQKSNYTVKYYLVNPNNKLSNDCETNSSRIVSKIKYIKSSKNLNSLRIAENDIIIDGLLGSGLTRPVSGIFKELIQLLNELDNHKIAIDIPSGMHCDIINNSSDTVLKSDKVISFQIPKRAFFFKENDIYLMSIHITNIGLSKDYYKKTSCNWWVVNSIKEVRNKHKTVKAINFPLSNSKNTLEVVNLMLALSKKENKLIVHNNKLAVVTEQIYIIDDKLNMS